MSAGNSKKAETEGPYKEAAIEIEKAEFKTAGRGKGSDETTILGFD